MDKSFFDRWFEKLGKAWSQRNPEAAASLFSKNCEYYEAPFNKPCASWGEILKLWQAIPENQKDVVFDFEVLAFSANACVANWKVSRTLLPSNERQLIDGIFHVILDEQGLCTYINQWRVVKKL